MNSHSFMPYDRASLGKRISVSGEHIVYMYKEDQVIKFPAGPIYHADQEEAYDKIVNESRLANTYFRQFMAPFKVFTRTRKGKKSYYIIQKFIPGRHLELSDTQNIQLKTELKRLIAYNNRMYRETGFTLEFFGVRSLLFHGVIKKMENVLVTENGELRIIDFGMISDKVIISSSPILRLIIKWAIWRQQRLLKKYLV